MLIHDIAAQMVIGEGGTPEMLDDDLLACLTDAEGLVNNVGRSIASRQVTASLIVSWVMANPGGSVVKTEGIDHG